MKNNIIIQVEVTTRCNHDCLYCPRYLIDKTRTRGDITPEMETLLIQRLSEFNDKHKLTVSVSGFGEPTLYPGLMELICKIKAVSNASIRLNTNASRLHKIGNRVISSNCVDYLTLSLNLPTTELYQKYTQTQDYPRIIENIKHFLTKKQDRKPDVSLRFIKTPDSTPHLEDAARYWERYLNKNDEISVAELSNWGGLIGEPIEPRKGSCRYLSHQAGKHLSITLDGYASICCFSVAFKQDDPLVVGNIKTNSIEALLSLAKLRANELRGSDICKYCNALVG